MSVSVFGGYPILSMIIIAFFNEIFYKKRENKAKYDKFGRKKMPRRPISLCLFGVNR